MSTMLENHSPFMFLKNYVYAYCNKLITNIAFSYNSIAENNKQREIDTATENHSPFMF